MDWILATVVRYVDEKIPKYEVEDVDVEEAIDTGAAANAVHVVPAKSVVALPTSVPEPSKGIEFPVGHGVLALFPGTTCFYGATVVAPPSKVFFF